MDENLNRLARRRRRDEDYNYNDIIINDLLPGIPIRLGRNQLTPRQYDILTNPEMYGRREISRTIEGYLRKRLRRRRRGGEEVQDAIVARRGNFDDRIADLMELPQVQNFINRGAPRGAKNRRRRKIPPPVLPRAPVPIGPDVLLNWRGLDRWNDVIANPGNYRTGRIRTIIRQMLNRMIREEFRRADRQAGIRGPLPVEQRPERNRVIKQRINNLLRDPYFQQLIAGGIRERAGRKPGIADRFWFWDYSKIHTTSRNPELRARRQAASNADYKAYLKREMQTAARTWVARHPDSVIAHGFY